MGIANTTAITNEIKKDLKKIPKNEMPNFSDTEKFDHFEYLNIAERNELAITLDVDLNHDELHITTPTACTEEQLTIEIFNEDGIVEFFFPDSAYTGRIYFIMVIVKIIQNYFYISII